MNISIKHSSGLNDEPPVSWRKILGCVAVYPKRWPRTIRIVEKEQLKKPGWEKTASPNYDLINEGTSKNIRNLYLIARLSLEPELLKY